MKSSNSTPRRVWQIRDLNGWICGTGPIFTVSTVETVAKYCYGKAIALYGKKAILTCSRELQRSDLDMNVNFASMHLGAAMNVRFQKVWTCFRFDPDMFPRTGTIPDINQKVSSHVETVVLMFRFEAVGLDMWRIV